MSLVAKANALNAGHPAGHAGSGHHRRCVRNHADGAGNHAETPPTEEQLTFSKEASAVADEMAGCSILYNWPVVGWPAATPRPLLKPHSRTHTHT
eukprot:5193492-Prymnesium_polylepis.1